MGGRDVCPPMSKLVNLFKRILIYFSLFLLHSTFRIGEVILETVRQKREYAAQMAGSNGHPSRGKPVQGLSGREILLKQAQQERPIEPIRREPARQVKVGNSQIYMKT